MNVRLETALLARKVLVDAQTGSISVYSIIDHILVTGFPIDVGPMDLMALWRVEKGDNEGGESLPTQIRFVSPNGEENKLLQNASPPLSSDLPATRWIATAQRVTIGMPGLHKVFIEYKQDEKWQLAGSLSFSVELDVEGAQAQPSRPPAT